MSVERKRGDRLDLGEIFPEGEAMGWLGAATEVLMFGGSDGPCWRRPGKISRSEWREFARQKREMMQRFNSEKEALIADNKRLREAQVPAVT